MFVLLTLPKNETLEVVLSQSIEIPVEGYEGKGDAKTLRVSLTFFGKKYKRDPPSAYIITLTAPSDVFFNFTSKEITPAAFDAMTAELRLANDTSPPMKYSIAQHRAHEAAADRLETRRSERSRILGFHPDEGEAGGVVGLLSRDLLGGVVNDPGRYKAVFKIHNRVAKHMLQQSGEGQTEKAHESPVPDLYGREWTMTDRDGETLVATGVRAKTLGGQDIRTRLGMKVDAMHGLTSRNPPQLRKALLIFTETVMFRTTELLRVDFVETDRESMQQEIRLRYDKLKTEMDWVQLRLDTLYDTVRRKNPTLMGALIKRQALRFLFCNLKLANYPYHHAKHRRTESEGPCTPPRVLSPT
ncbi:hypothetical protein BC830DRAFT_812649 [Chytriomyces sp. MP71]|nr:hypothetical protein BC830DRAFT_812649 [Chytriomyces sp. MP71]